MRIVSGKYRGRIINPPKNLPVRPTTDMAKESLFNILNNHIDFQDLNALDLFSGTGNISYEFVSRGCNMVMAVEKDFACVRFIKKTVEKMQIENLIVIKQDVFKFVEFTNKTFDIVFADPPYKMNDIGLMPDKILNSTLLNTNGWLIFEHPKEYDFASTPGFYDHRKYGSVNFSFFRR